MTTEELMAVPGYIILIRKPGDDKVYGPVENSWSLGVEPNRTFFYWTSEAQKIDGWTWANNDLKDFRANHPDWTFTLLDARDETLLPIKIDWPLWVEAHQPSDKTVSGVRNKHEARNLRFVLKTEELPATKCPELKARATTITVKHDGDISVETKHLDLSVNGRKDCIYGCGCSASIPHSCFPEAYFCEEDRKTCPVMMILQDRERYEQSINRQTSPSSSAWK